MINETYQITMETPMGTLKGTAQIQIDGNNLSGQIQAMGINSKFSDGYINHGNCKFQGMISMLFGKITYEAIGIIKDGKINLDINSNKGMFKIKGQKV